MARTRFTDPAAVDAWDQWFRWRNTEGLRDRTIDATWWRVADAIAPADGDIQNSRRYIDAFSRWQLLPDERLLRSAGTADGPGPVDASAATLNVSAFVTAPRTRQARLDTEGLARVATLAVRILDDAQTFSGPRRSNGRLRIGLIGLADALIVLGIDYEDTAAAEVARRVGNALALGTLRGTIDLARERGAIDRHPARRVSLWRQRGMPETLIADALRWGLRHTHLTAIERQPRLALLANNASDALDPALPRHGPGAEGLAGHSAAPNATKRRTASTTAQLALRAAIQPWIDAPIDYPLIPPADSDWQAEVVQQVAETHDLPHWRFRGI